MKKRVPFMLSFIMIVVIIGVVGVYGFRELSRPPVVAGEVKLPFEDGRFILSYEELNEGRFTFRHAESRMHIFRTAHRPGYRCDFNMHHAEFIDIMNDISPTLIEAFTADESNPYRNRLIAPFPFRAVGVRSPSYALTGWGHSPFFMMDIHEGVFYGYLSFLMFDTDFETVSPNPWSNYTHRSLYRITSDELAKLIDFAKELEIVAWHEWSGSGMSLLEYIRWEARNLLAMLCYERANH